MHETANKTAKSKRIVFIGFGLEFRLKIVKDFAKNNVKKSYFCSRWITENQTIEIIFDFLQVNSINLTMSNK